MSGESISTHWKLRPEQELRGAKEGYERHVNAIERDLIPRHRGNASMWAGHIEGACAELLVALYTCLPWTGEGLREPPFLDPDVGEDIEVRWVSPQTLPRLRVDQRDHLERLFVLVSGWAPTYTIHGYLRGDEIVRRGQVIRYPERIVHAVTTAHLVPLEPGWEIQHEPVLRPVNS